MARLKQRKLVWFVVGVAELMFFVELIAGLFAMSLSIQVDALSTSDPVSHDGSNAQFKASNAASGGNRRNGRFGPRVCRLPLGIGTGSLEYRS